MISGLERSLIWTISVALVMVGMYVGSLSSAVETSRDEIDRLRSTPERLARIETELMHLRTSVDGLTTVMDAHHRK
jgi:hypothetical protein